MATFIGKKANVYWDCDGHDRELAHCQSWNLDLTHDIVEITAMQDTWESFIGGYIDWSATVEALLDSAGSSVPLATNTYEALGENTPAKIELYFLWDNVTPLYKCLYGSAICTGISPKSSKDDVGRITYAFQGRGLLVPYFAAILPAY